MCHCYLMSLADMHDSRPVSYTHLDVYKRQIHYKQAFDDIFKENGGLSEDEFLSEESFINDEYPEDDEIYN